MAERVPSVPDIRRSVHGGHGVLHGQHVGLPQRGRHVLRGAGPQPREPAHVAAGHARAGTLQPDLGSLRTLLCRRATIQTHIYSEQYLVDHFNNIHR